MSNNFKYLILITLFLFLTTGCKITVEPLSAPLPQGKTPTVSTNTATNITFNSFTTGGIISSDGGSPVTERGIVYSVSQNPTTSNNKIVSTSNQFSIDITGLEDITTYYCRAYATNAIGTTYGEQITVTTLKNFNKSLKNGLVAYLPFNGNSNDISGNNLNGKIFNAVLTTDRNNKNNSAYYFNGQSSSIILYEDPKLDPENVTFSVWYNAEIKNSTILVKNNPTNALDFTLKLTHEDEFNGQKGLLYSYSYGLKKCESNAFEKWLEQGAIKENIWNHLVFSIDKNGNGYIYINGKKLINISDGIKYLPCNSSSASLRIGGKHWDSDPEFFKGKIDDFGMWNRVLTEEEIQYLFSNNFQP